MKKEFRKQAEHIVAKSGLRHHFPEDLDFLGIPPYMYIDHRAIDYIHSLGQDSPFFMGLIEGKLLSTWCVECNYRYGTPRGHCMYCGNECEWFELPKTGRVHAFTLVRGNVGSESFINGKPFVLAVAEFSEIDTLFLVGVEGLDMEDPALDWIGMTIEVRFTANIKRKKAPLVSDVHFVPAAQ